MRRIFLVSLMAIWASAGWAATQDTGLGIDGKGAFARLVRMQEQCDGLEKILKEHTTYGTKAVGKAVELLSADEDEASSVGVLNDCVTTSQPEDIQGMTLANLLEQKRKHVDNFATFLESQGVNISLLKEESQKVKAVAALSAVPPKEAVFGGNFQTNPVLGSALHLYLTLGNLGEFLQAQAPYAGSYGWGHVPGDTRLDAILKAGGRQYQGDPKYLWRNLMEVIKDNLCWGNIDGVNDLLAKLYNDTWAVNRACTGSNHHKTTPDAYRWLTQQQGTNLIERAFRGLKF